LDAVVEAGDSAEKLSHRPERLLADSTLIAKTAILDGLDDEAGLYKQDVQAAFVTLS